MVIWQPSTAGRGGRVGSSIWQRWSLGLGGAEDREDY